MTKLVAIEVGPQYSRISRLPQNSKKVIKLKNNTTTSFSMPKWTDPTTHIDFNSLDDLLAYDHPLGIHTGKSELIVLDFDDDELFTTFTEINSTLTEEEQCRLIVKSDSKGGHFYYHYSDNHLTKYIGNPNGKKLNKLDTLYGNTLVFAPTLNDTKTIVHKDLPLNTMPLAIQMAVIAHYAQVDKLQTQKPIHTETKYITSLAPLIDRALSNNPVALDNLLQIITPAQYKEIMTSGQYKPYRDTLDLDPDLKYHPNKIPPEESAHMYLVAISGVLMLDESVSTDIHKKFMIYLNRLFSNPLPQERLMSIVQRDITSPNYRYNSNWAKKTLSLTTLDGELIEIFMFNNKGQMNYLGYNHITKQTQVFAHSSAVLDFVSSTTGLPLKKERLIKNVKFVTLIERPDEPFGYNPQQKIFNTYHQTEEQYIFYNPQEYWKQLEQDVQLQPYTDNHPLYPRVTLAALKSAIGDSLDKFLGFMARKLKTRDYSPLFFVFLGVPHSFKSAVVNGVFAPLTYKRYKHLSLDIMSDKYNDWMINTDLVLLDEVHHLMSLERQKLIKILNEATGNSEIVGVRKMYSTVDKDAYKNELTFILTTNASVKLTTETRDRRMVVFKSTQRVADALGMSNIAIEKAIKSETRAFAYYLATQVEPLYGDDYISNHNWRDYTYEEFQEQALNKEDKLAKLIDLGSEKLFSYLFELGVTQDQIFESMYERRSSYRLRLYNTKEEHSSEPALLYHLTELDITKLKHKLQMANHVKYNVQDSKNGSRLPNRYIDIVLTKAMYDKYKLEDLSRLPEDED